MAGGIELIVLLLAKMAIWGFFGSEVGMGAAALLATAIFVGLLFRGTGSDR